jgi:serine/threonine protein phosphatase PrpC
LIQEGAITEEEAFDHPMRNFVECCIGGDIPVPDMSITARKPLEPGDVLLACSDGLWSGVNDQEIAELATRSDHGIAENLKAMSLKALTANSPHSDNTSAAILRWSGGERGSAYVSISTPGCCRFARPHRRPSLRHPEAAGRQ